MGVRKDKIIWVMERNYKLDNIKAILIFLVVLGHLLECFAGEIKLWIYLIIYSFHMPAFVYTTGYFATYNPKRIVYNLIYSYYIYQVAYILFQKFYLKSAVSVQFTTPYWLLWYLIAMIFWTIILHLFVEAISSARLIFVISLIIALMVGFDNSVGYYMSLSRTLAFFPFYVAGYFKYFDKYVHRKEIRVVRRYLCVGGIITSLLLLWHFRNQLNTTWFYYATSYVNSGSNVWIRMLLFIVATIWICFLLGNITSQKITFFSSVGRHTLPIFLLHGFIVKILHQINCFRWNEMINIILAFILAISICVVLGNELINKLFCFTFSASWIPQKIRCNLKNRKK